MFIPLHLFPYPALNIFINKLLNAIANRGQCQKCYSITPYSIIRLFAYNIKLKELHVFCIHLWKCFHTTLLTTLTCVRCMLLKHPKQKWFAASTIKVLHFILGIPKLFAVHARIKSGCIIDPKTNPHPNRIQL